MFSRILVPLDGSSLAELALPYAEELAEAFDSEITLIDVTEPEESEYLRMHQLYIEEMADRVRSHMKMGTGVKVKPVSTVGEPAQEIIDYAEENNISLITMTTHARSGIMPWTMGSIANKVLQRISMSVLLIRAKTPDLKVSKGSMFNKILIALDGSETSEAVLPYARELAEKLRSEVVLLQVVTPGQHTHTIGGLDYITFTDQQIESMKAQSRQYLEKKSKELTGITATIKCEVKTGDAAREIIKFAEETNTRLVAVSAHGRSGIKQWILGSVSHKIIQAGNTPTLLVKAPGVKK